MCTKMQLLQVDLLSKDLFGSLGLNSQKQLCALQS